MLATAPTCTDQKMELLEATGVDAVVVVTFDEAQAAESPESFVDRVGEASEFDPASPFDPATTAADAIVFADLNGNEFYDPKVDVLVDRIANPVVAFADVNGDLQRDAGDVVIQLGDAV